jgi:hypothetical protein
MYKQKDSRKKRLSNAKLQAKSKTGLKIIISGIAYLFAIFATHFL